MARGAARRRDRWPAGIHARAAVWRPRVPALPHDWSEALGLPIWLDALLSCDAVAYPLHATLGAGLNAFSGPAVLAGIEWLKAAAHARSASRLERAARGLVLAQRRFGDADAFERLVAATLIGGSSARKPVATYRARQQAALALVGGTPAATRRRACPERLTTHRHVQGPRR